MSSRHTRHLTAPPLWRRRLWFSLLLITTFALSIAVIPGINRSIVRSISDSTADFYTPFPFYNALNVKNALKPILDDPCVGRPTPIPIPPNLSHPPVLYFVHIPKTAGSLMYELVKEYANKTKGVSCEFLYDGNRFGSSDYFIRLKNPPIFPPDSMEEQVIIASRSRNRLKKGELYERGACRAIRGHMTYLFRRDLQVPTLSLTVVRDPLERFLSMYEFVHSMVAKQPKITGWDSWISGKSIEEELANSSSILNRAFYANGSWVSSKNVGFSFHFYGVLHQLSGINPVFEGDGDPQLFTISNGPEMAQAAKDNLCSSHILGTQGNMNSTLLSFYETMNPYAQWTDQEKKYRVSFLFNKTPNGTSRNIDDHVPPHVRTELERRLHHEIEVVKFAEQIIAYRESIS